MADFSQFLQRFFNTQPTQPGVGSGSETIALTSFQALASTEALIDKVSSAPPATTESPHPPDTHPRIHDQPPVSAIRAWFNGAIGQSLTGKRPCGLFTGKAGNHVQDLLQTAVQRHLPLLVHTHDHAAAHGFANSGCFVLWATTPQEAVDFTLIARQVAELALLPGVVVSDGHHAAAAVQLPSPTLLQHWLGMPADEIPVPTPAQQLLFGDTRRRIPNWHSVDRPVLIGAHQADVSQDVSRVAQALFFTQHLPDLLGAAFAQFAEHTGRAYDPVHSYRLKDAALTLVVQGSNAITAQRAADTLRRQHGGYKVGVLALRWRQPLPERMLVEQLSKQSRVVVLEPVAAPVALETPLLQALRATLARALENHRFPNSYAHLPALPIKALPRLQGVCYGSNGPPVTEDALIALCQQVKKHGQASPYLDDIVGAATSHYPKRQVYQETLRRLYPQLTSLGVPTPKTPAVSKPVPADREAPLTVRRLQATQPVYDSLARFWEQTGILYRDGNLTELSPEPHLAGPVIPPLSAALGNIKQHRAAAPSYDAQQCTACGQCWTVCPDAAIGAVTSHSQHLLNSALNITKAHALQPLAGQLAAQISALGKGAKPAPGNLGDLLTHGFAEIADKLPAARRESLETALHDAARTLQRIPIAASDGLFKEPEAHTPQQGEWLSLAINPDACKGCGLCVNHCPTQALQNVPQTPAWIAQHQQTWTHWNALPDTAGNSIQRLAEDPRWGPLPALLLSRHCAQTLASGDSAEPGSGPKLALRYVLAVTEYLQQPRVNQFLQQVTTLKNQLHQAIQALLSPLMPGHDLATLNDLLTTTASKEDLLQRALQDLDQRALDKSRLQQLIAHTQGLEKLLWRLDQGQQELGRARCGVLIAASTVAQWAAQWPDNPFQVPVTVDNSGAADGLAGQLLAGQWQPVLAGLATLKTAKLMLDKPAQAAQEPASEPKWRELNATEQSLCPPLWLVSDDNSYSFGIDGIQRLLADELPVKILLFTTTLEDNVTPTDQLGLLALAQQRAVYMAQTALSDTHHFFTSIQDALAFPGPALLRVYTPSPREQGFASAQTIAQAHLAVASRAMPLFRYSPSGEGPLGGHLDLTGNPELTDNDSPIAEENQQRWDLLQVLAGASYNPVPENSTANQPHTGQALSALNTQPEDQLHDLRQTLEQQLKARLRHNLLAMAGYPADGQQPTGPVPKAKTASASTDPLTPTPENTGS